MKKFIIKKKDGTAFGFMGDDSGVTGAYLTIGNDLLILVGIIGAVVGIIGTIGALLSKK